MRVAILNPMFGPGFTKSARWFARSRGRVQRHPDYLCIAAAVLEQAGHEIFFCDAQAKDIPTEDLIPKIRSFSPELVVCQASTPSIDADIKAAGLCKDATGARTVLVGSHVSAEPQDTLDRAGDKVDVVAIGEYDYTVRDLASGVALELCPGIAWRKDGQVVFNPRRPYIQDLDALPFPAWQHIDINDYRDAGKLFPFLTLISGRGCWGRCTFCQLPQVMNGHGYRPRSVPRIIEEIEYDIRLFPSLKEIMFEDDTLVAPQNRDRLEQLCEALLARNFGIAWSANARVDGADFRLLKLMKRAGCRMLCVGFEFGDQRLLDCTQKGTTLEEMHQFAHDARRAGIRVHGCFMIGGPGETPETAQKTLDLACSLPIDTAQFSGIVAYPGTAYYAWAKENGYLIPKRWRDWVDDDFEQVTTQSLPEMPAETINAFVDRGLKRFYLRPSQMCRMLFDIRNWADVRAKWHGLRSFVAYFCTRRTTRTTRW